METDSKVRRFSVADIIILINMAIFLVMFISDPNLSINTLIKFGAKDNYLIAEGEYFRLVTAMFLHANLMHLLFNSIALKVFSRDVELIFGYKKFLFIYFISGLLGTMGSFVFTSAVGVGASGAIFGLLGANLYLLMINPKAYKRIYGNDILILIAINLIYGFITPNIDNVAHLAGLMSGFIACWAVGLRFENIFKPIKRVFFQGLIAVLIVSFFLFAIPNYMQSWRYDLFKAYDLIGQGRIVEAKQYLNQGQSKNPNEPIFEEWLSFIEQFEEQE